MKVNREKYNSYTPRNAWQNKCLGSVTKEPINLDLQFNNFDSVQVKIHSVFAV